MSREQRRDLSRMRAVATGLLAAMAGVFLLASWLRPQYPWLGYVRAFAEAAMVGALADWFAVVALFRRPLGLPIPHTAVVPHNKERIGESLGRFVAEHFLPPEVVRARLAGIDFTGPLAAWLAEARNAEKVADQLAALLPDLLAGLDDSKIREIIRAGISQRLEAIEIAPLAGEILAVLAASGRHQKLVDEALRHSAAYIVEKAPEIRALIREKTGWLWQKLSLDERAFNAVMDAVEHILREVDEDPGHELRRRFDQVVQDFAHKLRESPDFRAPAAALQREVLGNPAFQARLNELWDREKEGLLADLGHPDSDTRHRLASLLAGAGQVLAADPGLHGRLDAWLREALAGLVETRRHELARLIPDTVRTWDAGTMSERLELQVGRDLQFIRINGTLVGGLVGLAIYAAAQLFG